jgi:hypothetical protein
MCAPLLVCSASARSFSETVGGAGHGRRADLSWRRLAAFLHCADGEPSMDQSALQPSAQAEPGRCSVEAGG